MRQPCGAASRHLCSAASAAIVQQHPVVLLPSWIEDCESRWDTEYCLGSIVRPFIAPVVNRTGSRIDNEVGRAIVAPGQLQGVSMPLQGRPRPDSRHERGEARAMKIARRLPAG